MPRAPDPNVSATIQVDALALANSGPMDNGAAEGRVWEAEFRTRHFPRLSGVAASDVPTVAVRLEFSLLDGKPVVHGQIRGSLELNCQRCLGRMLQRIDESFDLMLTDSEAQLDLVPTSYEGWLTHSGRLDVVELVEEQLLLAIPLIAKHEDTRDCAVDCVVAAPEQANQQSSPVVALDKKAALDTQRPFANLRDILRK